MAEPVGFEPTVGSTPTQLFESCTFGRSDTVPESILVQPTDATRELPVGDACALLGRECPSKRAPATQKGT